MSTDASSTEVSEEPGVGPARARRPKRWIPALLCSAISLALVEFVARSFVPACDITPFRNSSVPGLAVELRPGFETLYKDQVVRINSAGLRGPEVGERDPAKPRIAVVGDSFAFGTGVALEDTIASQLQSAFGEAGRQVEVLNFGVPGYCALNVAAVVEHKALKFAPDLVLYVFFANDVDEPPNFGSIPSDARIDTLKLFPLRSAGLEGARALLKRVALTLGYSLVRRTNATSIAEYESGGGARVREAITRMRDACAASGVPFRMAAYPYPTRVDLNTFRPIDEMALADAGRLGVPTLDLLEAFEGEADLSHYHVSLFDQHPDAAANAKVGKLLARWLGDALDG